MEIRGALGASDFIRLYEVIRWRKKSFFNFFFLHFIYALIFNREKPNHKFGDLDV